MFPVRLFRPVCYQSSIARGMLVYVFITHYGFCFPTSSEISNVSIVKDERMLESVSSGKYSYALHLSDGSVWEQNATMEKSNKAELSVGSIKITGRYSFVDSITGIKHEVEYEADKNGYRPRIIMTVPSADSMGMQSKGTVATSTSQSTVGQDDVVKETPPPPLNTISASLFSSPDETK